MKSTQFYSFETFDDYWSRIQKLHKMGKTTGNDQSLDMLNYTALSIARTKRGLQKFQINEAFEKAVMHTKALKWLIITEAWCGDASNTIPVMINAALKNTKIELRVMVRDEYPDLMNNYLTNGSRSIPILVLFDENFNELKRWGPRPKSCQQMIDDFKSNVQYSKENLMIAIQKWYVQDATIATQQEITDMLNNLH